MGSESPEHVSSQDCFMVDVKCMLKPGVCALLWGPVLAPACCAAELMESIEVCAAGCGHDWQKLGYEFLN